MNENDFDEIVYNDLDDEYCIQLANDLESGYETKYHRNGVKIIANALDMNFTILTDKWSIYWYVYPYDTISIYDKGAGRFVLETNYKFDMPYFSIVEDANVKPGDLDIVYSDAELVDRQVQRILNLKVFL